MNDLIETICNAVRPVNYDADKSVEIGRLKQKIDSAIVDIEKLIELSNDTPFVNGYLKGILNDLKR